MWVWVCVTSSLTGVEDCSKHPALAVSHSHPGLDVLLQDGVAARPLQRGRACGECLAPVPLQDPVIVVLGVDLQPEVQRLIYRPRVIPQISRPGSINK